MHRQPELDRGERLSNFVRMTPPFVGRRQELDWIEGLSQEGLAGQPHLVLIQGEAGTGKMRLLREVWSKALRRRSGGAGLETKLAQADNVSFKALIDGAKK